MPILQNFFGTALLILLGNGVVANVCLNKTKGQSSGWIVITTAWAFAVYVAVVVTGPLQWGTLKSCGNTWRGNERRICLGTGTRLHRSTSCGGHGRCVVGLHYV